MGELRENPFEIGVVLQAQSNLYENPTTEIEATHLYVKFTPSSMDDILKLEETDADFSDYPLEYEVITMGDYYQDIIEGTYPTLYTVVEPNFEFPSVSYEIISELYLTTNDPLLITECFTLTNNLSRLEDYLPANSGMSSIEISDDAIGMVPNIPDCGYGCHAVLVNTNPGGSPSWEWHCTCPPPPPPTTNEYGCVTDGNSRFPGGTIVVEDTQLGFKGVRRVKVIIRNQWFLRRTTWTDDNGCWSINTKHYGKAWMWVKFKNNRCRIRGTQRVFAASWQWITSVTNYVGKIPGPYFSNIMTHYHMWSYRGSKEHVYWGAATVNNALHEFHDYATQDGINTPPTNLDIYVGRNNTYGYALMNTQFYVAGLVGNGVMAASHVFAPFVYLDAAFGTAAAIAYLPDVYIGIDFKKSDKQKSLAYHELAHTSHYDQVGYNFWTGLVNESILANGHGDQNTTFRNKLELCESWAEFLGGMTYTHRTYPTYTSTSINSTWEHKLEHTWNEKPNHIPIGLHHDLMDIGEPLVSYQGYSAKNVYYGATTVINDNVSGFTIQQMFNSLNSSTINTGIYKNELINNYLGTTSNTNAQMNDLFNSY